MVWVYFFIVLAGFVCFLLAIRAQRQPARWNLVAAGLACWILVDLIVRFRAAAGV